ncbi:MAG: glycine betaine ABC transporter substrate-binding protein [Eubacteriales bacterium]|jgi:glycine betaine/choline ABC-type transport system substrate-binding protein
MKKKILLIAIIMMFLVAALFTGCGGSSSKTIVVGAKDYTEQDILGNMLTILLQENTDYNIEYKHEMSSNVLFAALQSGDVDLCIDYTGTLYSNYLNYSDIKGADEVYDISVKDMSEKYKLDVLKPLGFNNTYCLAVRPETAQQYNLKTFSDLAKVSSDMVFGGGFEILNRNDGIPKLKERYNMSFKEELAVEGVLRYSAIENNETQITEAFSTDGMLLQYNLVVLEDDLNFFPPYHAVPLIRQDTAKQFPEVVEELDKLAGVLNDDKMRELNYQVDVEKKNPHDVAAAFLKSADLIK